ncbi:CHRD domain-containing protein [Flavisericum labens]|uniref:CHRD domain-containing protein n=1 Tax=Flavisericum labens TaxID=3377112 RepID=UPI00387AE0DC
MIKFLFKTAGRFCLLVALGLMLSGCSHESLVEVQEESLTLTTSSKQSASKMNNLNFPTHLSGDNEVPARETTATGQAIVRISKDESSIAFKLIVANVSTDITGAHFHIAPAGSNGGVVVNLLNISDFPPETSAPVNGMLAEGTITASDLTGSLLDKPLSDLIMAIQTGNIYINVHTTTYPGGELRGQL